MAEMKSNLMLIDLVLNRIGNEWIEIAEALCRGLPIVQITCICNRIFFYLNHNSLKISPRNGDWVFSGEFFLVVWMACSKLKLDWGVEHAAIEVQMFPVQLQV
mmetsp:Transcript_23726/g.29723  ORF Transcript_23726/g.29723 Transcript_23726/m.29723 type:complete len:103 (-) Transcript_23726:142-450(-)